MSSDPRSQRLLAWHFTTAGASPAFVCPDSHIVLVKSLAFYNNSGVEGLSVLILNSPLAGAAVNLGPFDILGQASYFQETWHVLNPGDQVVAWSNTVGMTAWVSGAVLRGPVPVPPAETATPRVPFVPPQGYSYPA